MPTAQRKNIDAEAAADSAPVADTPAPVEAAAALAVVESDAAPVEAQPPHPDDLWQHDEKVDLIFTGESGTVVFPLAALTNGQSVPVPKTLVESYLRSGLFITPAQA